MYLGIVELVAHNVVVLWVQSCISTNKYKKRKEFFKRAKEENLKLGVKVKEESLKGVKVKVIKKDAEKKKNDI